MIVNLISVLIESTKSIDLVVAAVCDGSIDETGRTLAECSRDLGSVAVVHGSLHGGIGHDVCIV